MNRLTKKLVCFLTLILSFSCVFSQIGKISTSLEVYDGPYPTAPNRIENIFIGAGIGALSEHCLIKNFETKRETAKLISFGITTTYAIGSEWREMKQGGYNELNTCNVVMKSVGPLLKWVVEEFMEDCRNRKKVRKAVTETEFTKYQLKIKTGYKPKLVIQGIEFDVN